MKTCSQKCSGKNKNTLKARIKTNIERYGIDHPIKKSIFLNKMKETNLKKYGVEYIGSSKKIQYKIKNTKLKKYGKENIGNIKKTKENIIKYNKIGNNKYNLFITNGNKIGKVYHIDCNACGYKTDVTGHFIYNRIIKYKITPCIHCLPIQSNISGVENKFKEFLQYIYKKDYKIEQSNREILNGQEIDIFLPNAKIGIEINGLYWHNDSKGKDKNYHLEKTKKAKEKGIQLIHLFDDEIEQGMMLVYSILYNEGLLNNDIITNQEILDNINKKFGLELIKSRKVYARKLKIKSISEAKKGEKKKYKEILKKYHIQGDDNAKYYYILEEEKENGKNIPLSIMTFKKMSVDKNQIKENGNIQTFELSRYVTLPGIQIVGGFKKLLKAFKKNILKEYGDTSIKLITYSNLRYSDEDNNVYIRNGFKKVGFTGVNYYYFYEGRKYHRFKFRKDQLYNKYLPELGIPVDLDYTKESEAGMIEKMRNNGIQVNKIFDCGHIKWEVDLT